MTEEDQYNSTVGSNWWDLPSSSSSRSSTASSTTSSSSSSAAVSGSGRYVAGSSGWVQLHASTTDNSGGVVVGHGTDINNTAGSGSSTVAADYPNFMGCWNQQDLLLSEKGGGRIGSFRSMLQEGMGMGTSSSTTNYQQQQQQETDGGGGSMLFTSTNLQGCCLFESNQPQQETPSSSSLFNYGSYHPHNSTDDPQQGNYGLLPCNNESLIDSSNWSGDNNNNKLPAAAEFLRHSSPAGDSNKPNQQNSPFWSNMGDGERQPVGLFFPPLIQNKTATTPAAAFEEKPKIHAREIQISASAGTQKSSSASTSAAVTSNTKRSSRSEGSSAMPPFKVRKEKMGDRITALQQLVSPFGKTDTASVLSEAIEYIKFLHEQVGLLTTPYLKTGSSLQHQQQQIMTSSCDKSSSNVPEEDHHLRRQDLRSRGLCLVPVSSTFPVAHETSVDFWTPTFGATFR